jgi:hypothetical protein
MSEELNKDIRDFFIKIGEDIKIAFDECCPCICLNRARVHARELYDIENQVTEDMNGIDKSSHVIVQIDNDKKDDESDEEDEEDLKVEHFILEDNVVVRKNKVTYYYDFKEYRDDEFETKCVDSDDSDDSDDRDDSEDDFVIIY